ncbi:MAG: hypothetical protein QY307_02320 [Acidimicrobiia bacterium]|nr:MAG: hypothetical protein QY307_02320 [Acidimicrobiia bacterium]
MLASPDRDGPHPRRSGLIETGDGRGGLGRDDFYAEPTPRVGMHQPSRRWHALKVAFEKYWFRRWL